MNKLNLRKLIPGIISVFIIMSMGFATFATNLDLEAFVKRDVFLTKYYELDWKVDELDSMIQRLYKFTCDNVKSFSGTYMHYNSSPYFAMPNQGNNTYPLRNYVITEISDEGYLHVNKRFTLYVNSFTKSNVKTLTREIPASLCAWMPGIEPAPNCKVKYNIRITDTNPAQTSGTSSTVEVIMGPFKKFPRITGTGLSGALICEVPRILILSAFNPANSVYFAQNQEKEPTSWSSTTTAMYVGTINKGSQYSRFPDMDITQFTNDIYTLDSSKQTQTFYFSNAFSQDLSNATNVWIRYYAVDNNNINTQGAYAAFPQMNITSWNYR